MITVLANIKTHFVISRLAYALAVSANPVVLKAETITAAPMRAPEAFRESFDDYPETSVTSIVGVTLGGFSEMFRDNFLSFGNPAAEVADEAVLCLQVMTQDGRFSASNPYYRGMRDGETILKAAPVSRGHMTDLAAYEDRQVAVRGIVGTDINCFENESLFLARLGRPEPDMRLVVQIMSRNHDASIALTDPVAAEIAVEAACTSTEGTARLAFDKVCDLALPRGILGKVAQFKVTLDDGLSQESTSFRVFLPKALVEGR